MREPCVWQSCVFVADDVVLGVTLMFDGKTYTKGRIPLCDRHLREFGRSRRMTLRAEFLYAREKQPGPNGSRGR